MKQTWFLVVLLNTAVTAAPSAKDEDNNSPHETQKPVTNSENTQDGPGYDQLVLEEPNTGDFKDVKWGKLKSGSYLPSCTGEITEKSTLSYETNTFLEKQQDTEYAAECKIGVDISEDGVRLARFYDSFKLICKHTCRIVRGRSRGQQEVWKDTAVLPTEYNELVTDDKKQILVEYEKKLRNLTQKKLLVIVRKMIGGLMKKHDEIVIARGEGKIDMAEFEKEKKVIIARYEKQQQEDKRKQIELAKRRNIILEHLAKQIQSKEAPKDVTQQPGGESKNIEQEVKKSEETSRSEIN